ncbi:DoxX family protein [Aneurinibacillus sp. Ricciae_BoGa-3]|uniref:DoxX family protein n=1 Tax=Aneurinibacillus sp. Ricciae_BoGa-3 TaxID=3022697 RepID=UPI0023421A34|nr:DoxX family protein [Aneurinibacillus sp. Ricciae_BoGa-3]WCK52600.1 DoxX family protein [Aneurinibacillus sp. Ricciae_BoGa-3]
MNIVSFVLDILLALMFLFLGISAIVGAKKARENFQHLNLPDWFRLLTGVYQTIGAVGLVIGFWLPWFKGLSGIWIAIMMLVAIVLHLRVKEPFLQSVPAIVVFLLSVLVIIDK